MNILEEIILGLSDENPFKTEYLEQKEKVMVNKELIDMAEERILEEVYKNLYFSKEWILGHPRLYGNAIEIDDEEYDLTMDYEELANAIAKIISGVKALSPSAFNTMLYKQIDKAEKEAKRKKESKEND